MSEALQQMLQAMNGLAESIRNVSIGNSIQKAQARVDQIRQDQTMDEFQRIEAQQALAKAMGAEVVSRGGNAFMAQQAMASLAPEVPDMQMQQLKATGKGTIAEATQELQKQQEQKILDAEKRAFERQKELLRMKQEAEETMYGFKSEDKKFQPLSRQSITQMDEVAQQASEWTQIANKVESLGAKNLLTPEALGDTERTVLERVRAASEAKSRTKLFGASLTPREEESFETIRGSLAKSGFDAKRYAAGFKALADLQKQVYVRSLKSNAIAKIGRPEQLLKHLASNKSLFSPQELRDTALGIKSGAAADPNSVEAELGLAPSNNAAAPQQQQAPAANTQQPAQSSNSVWFKFSRPAK